MNLIFDRSNIKSRNKGLTFDDVLIIPSKSDVRSRRVPELHTHLTKKTTLHIPIISANMDTITEHEMALAMNNQGGLGILHRFMTVEEQVKQVYMLKDAELKTISASIGVGEDFRERAQMLIEAGVNLVTMTLHMGIAFK